MRGRATMRLRNSDAIKENGKRRAGVWAAAALLLAAASLWAQTRPGGRGGDFTISLDVDLVVLHATVVDTSGHYVTELTGERFKIFEDGVEQKVAVFRDEDVPITVGLVLDNSASMRENRRAMVTGALAFAGSSNPLDEVFVVNFMDDYYLDLEGKDFTSDINELKAALEKTTTQGNTAYYDAVRASLQHLRRGTRQKKALLIISDGADRASVSDFNVLLEDARKSEAAIYIVSPPCQDEGRRCRNAKREIRKLAQASGGMAYFPTTIEPVETLCRQIAHDIGSQYVLGYYPTNKARDGSFRTVRVEVAAPPGYKKLTVRTRTGYYAQGGTGSQ